jgi:hypothetical protein
VEEGALACPACGSDAETGWSDAARFGDISPYDDDLEEPRRGWSGRTQFAVALVAALALGGILSGSLPAGLALAIPLLALALGVAFRQIRRRQKDGSTETQLYQSLLRMAMGDEALAERLIAYERERSDADDRRSHIQDAIDRWLRDAR